jgi:Ca2+-binding EF-hand superfamily protein
MPSINDLTTADAAAGQASHCTEAGAPEDVVLVDVVDQWYNTFNDEAGRGQDNEMSKREVAALSSSTELSAEEQSVADFVLENRKQFDVDGNGRLNREEFHAAVQAAKRGDSGGTASDTDSINAIYERYNDEAARGRDNEMSKREVLAFKEDQSLSEEDAQIAEFMFDNRKQFDLDNNGRLNRDEFIQAFNSAKNPDSVPPENNPLPEETPNVPGSGSGAGTSLNGEGEVRSLDGSKKITYTADKDVTLVVAVNASHGQDSDTDKLPEVRGLGDNITAGNNDIGVTVSTMTLSAGESVTFTVDTKGGKGAYMVDTIDGHYRVSDSNTKRDGSWGLEADSRGDLYGYFGAYDDGATSSSARDAERDGFELKNGGDVLIWKVGQDRRMDPDLVSNEGKGGGGNKGQIMLTFDKA